MSNNTIIGAINSLVITSQWFADDKISFESVDMMRYIHGISEKMVDT
jgi:hypothetical protein